MTKRLKVKVTIEWRLRDGEWKPAIFSNAYAYVKNLGNGLYRICAINRINGKKVDVYCGTDKFDIESKAFVDAG